MASEHPTIRALSDGDAERAAAFVRAAFAAQDLATDPPSSALRETADGVRAFLAEGGGFGAHRGGSLAALLLYAERDGGLYCGRLAVAPEARGGGLARALLAEAEREAVRRGLPRLHVRVRLALAGNLALFARLGFREVARDAHPGYVAPTIAILEKRLPGRGARPPAPAARSLP